MPRHAARAFSGTWRPERVGLWAVVAVASVLAVVAVAFGGYRLLAQPSCGNPIQVSVAAAPDIEPVVRAMVRQWTASKPRVNNKCVAVTVRATDPADVAAAIAGQHRATLSGIGQAGAVRPPNVWVPDSSSWLQRLRTAGPDWVSADAIPVARSPVVLAVPAPAAAAFGPPGKLTWAALLSKLTSDAKLKPGIVDPNRDAASTTVLLALAAANATGDQQATIAALRNLGAGRSALRADMLAHFPRAADAGSLASGLSAAPLSEQAVIAYNASQPSVPLTPLYVEPAPAPLDYPLAVLPGATRDQAAVARAVTVTLTGDTYRDRLAERGLRAADGSAGRGFAAPKGAPKGATPVGPATDPQAIVKLLSTWNAVLAPGRMLTVIDVSGSMATPVPAAGGATRDQIAAEAARRGLGLLDDTWAVGLWIFSTQLDAGNDWKQLVPIGTVAAHRQDLLTGLATIQPKANGGTGLYNTVLAAYKNVQASWDPGRVNSVLIMTDGKNEDAPGLTLAGLVDQLKQTADPARPVAVIALGIGDQVSRAELQTITDTTGGATLLAPDPSKIADAFLQALGLRPGANR
jgi:hypothetical protein